MSKAETFISSCFSLCFSLLIIPNHWDYDLYFPVTFYIRDGPALNPFPDLLTKEITDPIKLISLLYSYSCSLFISTVFLPISSQMSFAYIMFSPFILLIAITSLKSLLYHVPYYRTDLYACKVLHNLAPPQVKYFFRGFFSFLFHTFLESLPLLNGVYQPLDYPMCGAFLLHIANIVLSFPRKGLFGDSNTQPCHLLQYTLFVDMRSGKGRSLTILQNNCIENSL